MKKTFRRILSALLVAVMLVCIAPLGGNIKASAFASSGQCGENVYWTFDESTDLLTISGEGEMYDNEEAFQYNEVIKTVVIKNGVTSIGDSAFSNCTDLTSIAIPDSVTIIGDWAFHNCTGLTGITIPDSITSIGDWAFFGCVGLTSITIPDSVTSIWSGAFSDCASLTSITVDSSNKIYDSRNNCNAIIETATNTLIAGCKNTIIPDGVTSIGDNAFGRCTDLTSITIPDGVTSIGDSAFSCTGLTSITIPDSVTSIDEYAFSGCKSLTSITIPDSVTSINDWTFSNCTGLTSITIPGCVTSIGVGTFYGCTGLTSITIPDSVTSIGRSAFSQCTGLKSISIPNSVTSTGDYAFNGCSSLNDVYIGDSLKSIGHRTFANCTELKNVYIGKNVTEIIDEAFFDCKKLEAIHVPESVTRIGWSAFYGCSSLKDVYLDKNLEYIGINAFPKTSVENVFYSGTEDEWNHIEKINDLFENATIHYNYSGSHTHTLKHITVPSTCKVAGTEYDICEDCGETFNETTLPLTAHTWDDWSIVEAPTETANGTGKRTCSVCGASESIELAYKEDKESKVQLMFPYMPNTTIVVKDETQTIGDLLQAGLKTHKLYDITMLKDNQPIQPDGTVTVRIPVPNDFDRSRARVYHIKSRNPIVREEIPSRIEGNEQDGYFIVFKTNHFSYFAIVEESRNVKSVSIGDITLNYKKSTTLNPTITADEGAEYTVKFSSSNPSVARVDENGNVYAAKKGSATITCTVTDSNGNTVTDTCNVKVKYSFGQWLIVIVLFGWIWY